MEQDAWSELTSQLFPDGSSIDVADGFVAGTATIRGIPISVVGTIEHAAVGVDVGLRTAGELLRIIRHHPLRPILIVVDTAGQSMKRREELLGINRYLAHLAKCVAMARHSGHHVISLVYDHGVSGGFLAGGMMAEHCYALPGVQIQVMNLPAMARVTKISPERLEELGKCSPVFAPGVENYREMRAIEEIWHGDLGEHLATALTELPAGGTTRSDRDDVVSRTLSERVAEDVRQYGRI